MALVGDSAGGSLALSVLGDSTTSLPAITAIAVFSPWLDLAMTGASFTSPDMSDPIFFKPEMLTGPAGAYLAGTDPKDGRASPLYAISEILPPLLIQAGGNEVLLDDARRYAQRPRTGAARCNSMSMRSCTTSFRTRRKSCRPRAARSTR